LILSILLICYQKAELVDCPPAIRGSVCHIPKCDRQCRRGCNMRRHEMESLIPYYFSKFFSQETGDTKNYTEYLFLLDKGVLHTKNELNRMSCLYSILTVTSSILTVTSSILTVTSSTTHSTREPTRYSVL